MGQQPRPVPPVVQPEVIADWVYRVARNPHRELWIGSATLKAILANMLLPEALDRYLARKTVEAQQTRAPVSPMRRDNLNEPVHHLHRTRGSFDREASGDAVAIPGPVARIAPIAIGALALFAVGLLARGGGARR
jgi:hypothetical protein